MKCIWCHNPETISAKRQLGFFEHKCTLCGRCASVCSCHKTKGGRHVFERERCSACGKCAAVCPAEALEIFGEEMECDALLDILVRDKSFYESSGGGVTLSGGECLLQADFCAELLEKLKDANIDDLKSIVRELGSYNKKAVYIKEIARIIVDDYNGIMPRKRKELEEMPGVGRKTINVLFSELDIEPNIAVDTHVERVSKRLGLAKKYDNVYEIEMKLRRKFKRENWNKRHKQLVLFGRYYCKAIKPECDTCGLKDICKEKR